MLYLVPCVSNAEDRTEIPVNPALTGAYRDPSVVYKTCVMQSFLFDAGRRSLYDIDTT